MNDIRKPAIHASMLSMLSKCGEMARWRYVEGVISPPGVAFVIGSAVGSSSASDLVSKMNTGALLDEEDVVTKAADVLDATWEGEHPLLDDDERERGAAIVKGEAKDEAVALALLHHRELAPIIEPVAVEKRMRLELVGYPMDIEGTPDVVEADRIRDLKTAKRAPNGGEAEGHPQLGFYTVMRSVIEKRETRDVVLDFLVKNKTPRYVQVSAPAPTNFTPILRRIEAAAKVFETGAFYPVDKTGPSGWVCQPKWCGYYERCVFGRAARTQVQAAKMESAIP